MTAPKKPAVAGHAALGHNRRMTPTRSLPFLLALCLVSAGAAASTTSFRCKNDLVNVGDGKASALLKCGEPLVRDAFCKPQPGTAAVVAPKGGSVVVNAACVTVDEWTYNPGYGQFMTTLRFESGKLVSITYGDRVK